MSWAQQDTGFEDPISSLHAHLAADALLDQSLDEVWTDANMQLRMVLMGLYETTGAARRGYQTDQRLPSAHAQALK